MTNPNDSEALTRQSQFYPANFRGRVPKAVLMAKTVIPDLPATLYGQSWKDYRAIIDQRYPVFVNANGAVSAILPNGKLLGLRPSEFDVVEWHETKQ